MSYLGDIREDAPQVAETQNADRGGLKEDLCTIRRNLDGAVITAYAILNFLVGSHENAQERSQSAGCMMEETGLLCSQSEMLHMMLDKIAGILGMR